MNKKTAICRAKIGSMSTEMVEVDREPCIGKKLKWRHLGSGCKWQSGRVWKINEDGIIYADSLFFIEL